MRLPRRPRPLLAIAALALPGALEALPEGEAGGGAIERMFEPSPDETTGADVELGIDYDRLEEQVLGLLPDGAVVSVARALVDRRVELSVSGDRALVLVRITLD